MAIPDQLAKVNLFSTCSKRDLQKIARASDEVSVDEGRVLVEQGKMGHEAFVILEGKAAVKRNGRKVSTLGPGDQFGELALLDGGPRTATVQAETPMKVLVLTPKGLATVLEDVPSLSRKMLASLAGRIRELDQKAYG